MLKNEQLWGEVERLNTTWNDLISNTWGDFRPLKSTVESIAELKAQGVSIDVFRSTMNTTGKVNAQGVNVEYSPAIIENTAKLVVSVSVAKRNYKRNMIDCLPKYYRKSKIIDTTTESFSKEFKRSEFNINDAEENLFIDTTISKIGRWEDILGITKDQAKGYAFRREKIKAKRRATGTTTKEMIKNVASAFSDGQVVVIEDNENYSFIVKFTGTKGIPKNMSDLTEIINDIKPAHLNFEYSYTYNTWSFVSSKIWQQAETTTWSDIQIFN